MKYMINKKSLWVLLLVAILLISACGSPASTEEPAEEEVDMGVPVASVNGEPIYETQFQQVIERMMWSYEQQGMDFSGEEGDELRLQVEESVLDHLIQQAVLIQEAETQNLTVSDEEVDAEFEGLKSQFDTEEEFQEILENTMFTEAELKETLKTEMTIESLLESVVEEIEVGEEDIETMYASYEEQFQAQMEMMEEGGEELTDEEKAAMALPPYEEIKEELRLQLLQEKQQEAMMAYVDELMESSEIEKLM